ncbi:MAG: macrolide ABC transporter ATP-binding protein [Chlamydiae bacterium]|nr:MAG: macrolide ABC transporter ATP-binding protein [Chlamydiota bacterium]
MNKPIIKINNITKIYNTGKASVAALKNVNLIMNSGDLNAIVGPSGSGKSTLMHILGCLDQPTSGSYFLDDLEVSALNPNKLAEIRNRKIGFVFQSFNLLPYLNAFKNVELPMIFAGINKYDRKKRVDELLDLVEMSARALHKPTEMSGGEQQRIAVARSLANDPEIILADEPTGNLDSKIGDSIMNLFINLWQTGKTIIMITHDPKVADKCERKIKLLDGEIKK